MKSGGWAKGRAETKLLRVDKTVHETAVQIATRMLLPIKTIVEMAIRKMAKEHEVE